MALGFQQPARPRHWLMRQRWERLLFARCPVDPGVMRARLERIGDGAPGRANEE